MKILSILKFAPSLLMVNLALAQTSRSGPIATPGIYANHTKVAAALAKGGLLFENPDTPAAIKVSGVYRDKAGAIERNEQQTSILYISSGEATLIAGDGQTFRLTKGDMVVIPAGVPHRFSEVPKSISYHLIKLSAPPGGTGALTHIGHDKVANALDSKGEIFSAPKLRLSGGYRTGPDQPASYNPDPEIHPAAIDIFYCIDGAATIVTGGKFVGMKQSGRNRMAGARVEQGRS
ncbi:MAG: cupin domain-containing protein, partial [Acidobacteria bacterium]|nr:cupin domain-containing protein [Acidobacteriota bacterium]